MDGNEVVRVVMKVITNDDLKKIDPPVGIDGKRRSVSATTGNGGADVRFIESLGGILSRMFKGRRPAAPGRVTLTDPMVPHPSNSHPKTTVQAVIQDPKPGGSRSDWRMIQANSLGIAPYIVRDPTDPANGKRLLVLAENAKGEVRAIFTHETSIRSGGWDPAIEALAEKLFRTSQATSTGHDFLMRGPLTMHARDVLQALIDKGPVLLSGPPGTGKTRLMSEVEEIFIAGSGSLLPTLDPTATPPIPAARAAALPPGGSRKSYHFPMYQAARHGDFVTGLEPIPSKTSLGFQIVTGPLYEAAEHAKQKDAWALLIIDELSRGPAVDVFGPALVALDRRSRLDDAGKRTNLTQVFSIREPSTGKRVEYGLPPRLLILAGRNTADVSAITLDTAFLRRWHEVLLPPSEEALRDHYKLPTTPQPLAGAPAMPDQVLEAMVQAFAALNERIGKTDQANAKIGHGLLIEEGVVGTLEASIRVALDAWSKIRTHLVELFDARHEVLAAVLNATNASRPMRLVEQEFAGSFTARVEGMDAVDDTNIYDVLVAIAGARVRPAQAGSGSPTMAPGAGQSTATPAPGGGGLTEDVSDEGLREPDDLDGDEQPDSEPDE